MADRPPIPVTPVPVTIDGPDFADLLAWPFVDPFVGRLLRTDVPRRVQFYDCRLWVYRDPDGVPVGFGTLDVCHDYSQHTGGRPHPYIPLLATNPTVKSRGYGTSIVRHLIAEAALLASREGCHDHIYLDVYTTSTKAIELYTANGFVPVGEPQTDPAEGESPYLIMARRVAVALVPTVPPTG